MEATAYQTVLNLGAESHYQLVHGKHKNDVYFALKNTYLPRTDSNYWAECRLSSHDAHSMAGDYARTDIDAYMTMNGFSGKTHQFHDTAVLTSFYIDFDNYKQSNGMLPDVIGVHGQNLLDRIRIDYPSIPIPTFLTLTGRGTHMVWVLDKPMQAESNLWKWRDIQDKLVDILKPYGADPVVKDCSRFLRVIGSTHTGTNRKVQGKQIADPIAFKQFKSWVYDIRPPKSQQQKKKYGNVVPFQKKSGGLSGKSVGYKRIQDLKKLIELRGDKISDCRERILFIFAASCAWYCRSIDELESMVDEFASAYFAGNKYSSKDVKTVIDRMRDSQSGKKTEYRGKKVDPRYRFRHPYIIELLEITSLEQEKLGYIISAEEKERRRTEKRRKAGEIERAEYEKAKQVATDQRALIAHELKAQGFNNTQIAKQMKCTRQTVINLLSRGVKESCSCIGGALPLLGEQQL